MNVKPINEKREILLALKINPNFISQIMTRHEELGIMFHLDFQLISKKIAN